MYAAAIASHQADTLRAGLAGDVYIPGDEWYDEARRAWNLAKDQRPAAVVFAESAPDVVAAVRFARSQGMRVAPQGTGHGALPLEHLDGAMLLKTEHMRQVAIDRVGRTAHAEAGALWQDVTIPAGKHGLAALAGTSPNVGVTGYTLGGGIGWLARRYGLAANSLTAVQIVTPDGSLVRADADHEADLFWAVRGGGGSVGVVIALDMTVYPVSQVYAGALFFPIERSSEVLNAWREWTDTVPDEVTSIGRILRMPDVAEVNEFVRGRAFAVIEAAYLGEAASGARLMQPLRDLGPELGTFAAMSTEALSRVHMDPARPVPAQGDGAFLADAPAAAICALLAVAGPDADTSLASIEIRHLGGALGRPAPGGGAQPAIQAKYAIFAGGFVPTAEMSEIVLADVRTVKAALRPWHAPYDYYNFTETPAEAHSVLPPESYHRLQRIKAAYDPDQAIISAHPVRPPGTDR